MDGNYDILAFAERHLSPFIIKNEEVVPLLCPFCGGGRNRDRETFAINIYSHAFNCKRGSCSAKGSFVTLAAHFGEKVEKKGGISFEKKDKEYILPQVELLPLTEEIVKYFEARKISRQTLDSFKIAASDDGKIIFPFYYKDKLVFVKYRNPWKPKEQERKEWSEPNTQPILFGMDACSFSFPLIITEGQIDALTLSEAGIPNAVSVPSGVNNFGWISPCWEFLEKFNKIILFGDNDEPGKEMVETIVRRLGEDRCYLITEYPNRPEGKPCKDANEIMYFYGAAKLREMIDKAEAVPVKGLIDLGDVVPIDPTTVPRIRIGIPGLDEVLGGLYEGDVVVLTGKSGGGKSTFAGPVLLNAIEQGKVVCAYSGELTKERFQQWVNLQCAGSDYITLKYDPIRQKEIPFVNPLTAERIRDWYRTRFFLFDSTEVFDTDEQTSILKIFSVAARRHGASVFLVDNLMTSIADADDEMKAQGSFVSALKKFAKRFKSSVILVAHPRKTKQGDALGKDDVSGNSAIVNLCDAGISVERPDLRIIKNRDEGIERMVSCAYAPDSRRIYQSDKGDLAQYSWDKTGIPFADPKADTSPDYAIQLSNKGGAQPF